MTPEEWQLLNGLADRIRTVPPQQKDPEADQFLRQLAQQRPDTAYVLAQTVIMQDFALRNAQAQIEELRRQLNEAGPAQQHPGSFLGGLFGGSPTPQPSTSYGGSVPRVNPDAMPAAGQPRPGYGPPEQNYGYPAGPTMQPSQTGDFLRNAASTATGIAGGALLFQGIRSLFSGHQGGLTGLNPFGSSSPRESLSEATVPKSSSAFDPGRDAVDPGRDAVDPGHGQQVVDNTDPTHSDDQGGVMSADYEGDDDTGYDDDGSDYA